MKNLLLEKISVKDIYQLSTVLKNALNQCKDTQIFISNELYNRLLKTDKSPIIWEESVLDSFHYNDSVEKAYLLYIDKDSQKQTLQMNLVENCSNYMQLTYLATKGIIYHHYLSKMDRILIVNSD